MGSLHRLQVVWGSTWIATEATVIVGAQICPWRCDHMHSLELLDPEMGVTFIVTTSNNIGFTVDKSAFS